MTRIAAPRIALALGLAAIAGTGAAQTPPPQTPPPQTAPPLPNPILYLTSIEPYSTASGNFMRYRYDVLNKDVYPAAMFAAAPALPPCGRNTNSARTWVDFFNGRTNARIYGFCALNSPNSLGQIWFALPDGEIPPSYIYIEMTDRQTNTRYRSNLADTVM